ncbi:MAG: hypothetical protein PHI34_09010 [Acidobacteriota bacterium]|nr:hypothetical protein [Acidobacteriota bacterium]
MNKRKGTILLLILFLAAAAATASAQERVGRKTASQSKVTGTAQAQAQAALRSGQAAIFLRNGDLVVDRIVDISSTRLVLETAASGEFPLRDIWMINYVDQSWNYPDERNRIDNNGHYVFLKDGNIASGRIVDMSSERMVYQFEAGGEVAANQILRIYFTPQVPSSLENQAAADGTTRGATRGGTSGTTRGTTGGTTGGAPGGAARGMTRGTIGGVTGGTAGNVSGIYQTMSDSRGAKLQLDSDGRAILTFADGGRRRSLTGQWALKRGDDAIVVVELGSGGDTQTLTFGRDGDLLIGIVYDKAAFGDLRLRRQ